MSANLEDPPEATGLEKVNPHPNSQELFKPKNVQTIRQLQSSPKLVRSCLKSYMLSLRIMRSKKFQMYKLGLEKAEEPDFKLSTFTGS